MTPPGRRLPTTLALLMALAVALAAAPAHAFNDEHLKQLLETKSCPRCDLAKAYSLAGLAGANLQDADLSGANLQGAFLAAANLRGADLSRANLQDARLWAANLRGAHLWGANLRGAGLPGANLRGARLSGANLQGAGLSGANLRGARLSGVDLGEAGVLAAANLQGAYLSEANLQDADLFGANLRGARLLRVNLQSATLAFTNLTDATYTPIGLPDSYVEGITGLSTVTIPYDGGSFGRTWSERGDVAVSGLVQLRELLQKAGLRDREREATFAIEGNKTHSLLFRPAWGPGPAEVRWGEPLALIEGAFRWVAFEWPVGYGLYPGFALQLLLGSILVFSVPYMVALVNPLTRNAGIWRVWAEDRVLKWQGQDEPERLEDDWYGEPWWRSLYRVPLGALWFSILSAFHIGFRELNVGTWLARLQTRDYTLRATGWVRAVAGAQSLLSVYLLALWALTYFGRPFQ